MNEFRFMARFFTVSFSWGAKTSFTPVSVLEPRPSAGTRHGLVILRRDASFQTRHNRGNTRSARAGSMSPIKSLPRQREATLFTESTSATKNRNQLTI